MLHCFSGQVSKEGRGWGIKRPAEKALDYGFWQTYFDRGGGLR